MPYKLSHNSLKNREGVDSRLIAICDLALQYSTIDFGIPKTGGVRSDEEQYRLYLKGKSALDGKLKISKHQKGLALDVFAYVDGKASWKPEHLTPVALAFLKAAQVLGYHLHWGGFWNSFIEFVVLTWIKRR